MNDRFPYDLPPREALVELIRRTEDPSVTSDNVTFEDMFFSPTPTEPGRTFIEKVDTRTNRKKWYVYRRLDLRRVIGNGSTFHMLGRPTPANVAYEVNRSRNMKLGQDDVSFSTTAIDVGDVNPFPYNFAALTGSYVYFGNVDILLDILNVTPFARLMETGALRYNEDGAIRELEHR